MIFIMLSQNLPVLLLLFLPFTAPLSLIHTSLKKPSKNLAVSLQITPSSPKFDAILLSQQLRKIKASSLWTADIPTLQDVIKEQRTAVGDFPGPCSVVFCGQDEGLVMEALSYGANAAVVYVNSRGVDELRVLRQKIMGDEDLSDDVVIWGVRSRDDAAVVSDGSLGQIFYVDSSTDDFSIESLKGIVDELSKAGDNAAIIACINAMQPNGDEIQTGRMLKTTGCTSVLVRNCCCGDGEDVAYATFVVNGLTSKSSSSFGFTGLTGSVNGHFGGVAELGTVSWQRTRVTV